MAVFERRRIGHGEKVALSLTRQQRDIVLERTWVPPAVADRLRFGLKDGDTLSFTFTLQELADLAAHVANESERADDPHLMEQLDEVYGRIVWVLDAHEEEREEEGDVSDLLGALPLEQLPEGLRAGVIELLQDPTIETTDQLQERLVALADEFSHRHNEQLGGLSPLQVVELLAASWDDPQGAVRINEGLPLEKLQGIPLLINARILLRELNESGGVKTTEAGNVPRAFVRRMVGLMTLPQDYRELILNPERPVNERDVTPLHKVRVLLEVARFIRKHDDKFKTTKKGNAVMSDNAAGQLYAAMFRALFRGMNLPYFDIFEEAPGVQEGIPYSLYVIAQDAQDWTAIKESAPRLILPFAKAELVPNPEWDRMTPLAFARILRHLEEFGLVEVRYAPDQYQHKTYKDFRKTPLFDEFLSFHLPE